jgi:hypothetical protein
MNQLKTKFRRTKNRVITKNTIVDTIIGLRIHQKEWLNRYREETGQSGSHLMRSLLDKEIKKYNIKRKQYIDDTKIQELI